MRNECDNGRGVEMGNKYRHLTPMAKTDKVLKEIIQLASRTEIPATAGNILALQVALDKVIKRLDIQTPKLDQVWKDRNDLKAAYRTARHGLEAITGKQLWPTDRLLSATEIAQQCLDKIDGLQ